MAQAQQQPKVKAKTPVQKISIIKYISHNSTPQARQLIVKFGQTPAKNMEELQYKMLYVLKHFGDDALRAFAKIHPDREMILDFSKMTGQKDPSGEYSYNNACGCGNSSCDGKCGCKKNKMDDANSNFTTNYRNDNGVYNDAEGERLIAPTAKKVIGAGAVILSIFALGVLLTMSGEKHRAY